MEENLRDFESQNENLKEELALKVTELSVVKSNFESLEDSNFQLQSELSKLKVSLNGIKQTIEEMTGQAEVSRKEGTQSFQKLITQHSDEKHEWELVKEGIIHQIYTS